MVHLDLFSGIGGFSQGLKQAGFDITKHYYAEVDKHAQAIYRHRFPNAEPVGDVRHVRGSELGKVDIITFGSPCQDFSLAGKRRGMDGERSSLITEAIRLINECRPDVFIWENVKGTFSSNNGADFFAILQAFANIGGYRCEWQLLNTAWILPQNRERIYLVGRIAERCAAQVFPITEANQITEQKRKRFCRKVRADKNRANCLTSRMHKMGRTDNYVQVGDYRHDEGLRWRQDNKSPTIPARARQDGSGQPIGSYAMGGSKKHRSCIGSQRVTEIGNEQESIRRLTEIECERLQGFEENNFIVEFDLCLDHLKNSVNAESKNHKLQKLVSNVGKGKKKEFVKSVNLSSPTKGQQKNKPVQNLVLIDLEHKEVQIHNLEKYHSRVNGVEKLSGFLHQAKTEDFALLIALINSIAESETPDGKVASHLNELNLTLPKNSKKQESKFGKETMQLAKDAVIGSTTHNQPLKCITSNHLSISSIEQSLAILSSFATHVITGFIPKKTPKNSLYKISFISSAGWTQYGNYDGEVKEVSGSQRYKCLGNAVTVDIVQMVGEAIRSNTDGLD